MTAPTTTWLRRITSPHPSPSRPPGRQAAALLLRLACVALLAWIGYIHLHLWLEGYRQIPTDGPLFLLDAVAAFLLAAILLMFSSGPGRSHCVRLTTSRAASIASIDIPRRCIVPARLTSALCCVP